MVRRAKMAGGQIHPGGAPLLWEHATRVGRARSWPRCPKQGG